MNVVNVTALEVLDSRGNPTVEATVYLDDGGIGTACAPSGASTGSKEALELRDGDKRRFGGKGVRKACAAVEGRLADAIIGIDAYNHREIDEALRKADGTENKSSLGANAILAVSLACAKAVAESNMLPLYRHLGGTRARLLPVPMLNILNGGAHASNNVDIQEFMVVPAGAPDFSTALRWGVEIFQELKGLLAKRNLSTAVGDEGGFAPDVDGVDATLDLILEAVSAAGRKPGREVWLALDCAANELRSGKGYSLPGEKDSRFTSKSFAAKLAKWQSSYPIVSIEDGMAEDDWQGWKELTDACGDKAQLVGDDLFVTDTKLLGRGMAEGVANAILVKPNQCGSLSETEDAVNLAQSGGYATVMSHRSGETEDSTIADLAVAWGCGQIKTGAPCRGERTAKFNRLLRIERELGRSARFPGKDAFRGAGWL